MDHVVIPLDPAHVDAVNRLAESLAPDAPDAPVPAPGGPGPSPSPHPASLPHITLTSYTDLSRPAALAALRPVADGTSPFKVHAHAYGIFTGQEPRDLSLHVPVVRTDELNDLQQRVQFALQQAGARTDGLTDPRVWTPHITLLDRDLTPARLARAVEILARRPHCSWSIPVEAIAVGSRTGAGREPPLPLRGTPRIG